MWFLIGGSTRQASAYALQYADDAKTMRLRWKTNLIPITFSTSLTKPNLYIRPESDITGAAMPKAPKVSTASPAFTPRLYVSGKQKKAR